jgi:glycosyltransferase involved in cell wall biosynthesis
LPGVATEVGQCPDVLAEGKVGIIVPPRQPERLAEGLIALLESPELRRQFGDRFQQRVNEVYSPQAAIAQVESFYQEVYQRPDHQVHS